MNSPVKPSDIKPREDAPAPVGHNRPPPYDPDQLAALIQSAQAFADAGGEWLDLKEITSEAQAEYLADYIAGARKQLKGVEAWRVEAKRPHDDAARAVQVAAARPKDILEASITKALALLNPWQVKKKRDAEEKARRERQEAEAKRQEAERLAAQAAARNDIAGEVEAERLAKEAAKESARAGRPVAVGVVSASGGGRTVALVEVREAQIDNLAHVFMFFREAPEVRDVLQRLANAHVRAKDFDGKAIPGTTTITRQVSR